MSSSFNTDPFRILSERLRNADLEREYRAFALQDNINQAVLFITITTIPVIMVSIRNAMLLLSDKAMPNWLFSNFILQLVVLTILLGFAFGVRFVKSSVTLELVLLVYMITIGVIVVGGQMNPPPDYVGTVYLIYIVNNLLLMPVPTRTQTPPTVVFIAAISYVLHARREPTYATENTNQYITMISLLIISFAFSLMLGRHRRLNFLHFKREEDTRTKLEAALGGVKQMTGIIPICKSCNDILDDTGTWQPIQTYITQNSKAEFSQGICPNCSEKS